MGITPAHAGTTYNFNIYLFAALDHPRPRGDYFSNILTNRRSSGSPPPTRGLQENIRRDAAQAGITPAHAGTTHGSYISLNWFADHPRPRGDYCFIASNFSATWGSPPPTRGLHLEVLILEDGTRITPAHAGTTEKSW